MKKYSADIIKRDKLIVVMNGVGRYQILRTGAELFKADVPACIIPFESDNYEQTADNMLLLSDRFGADIIIGAGNISCTRQIKVARKNGAKMVSLSLSDEKLVRYAKHKGLIVLSPASSPEEALLMTEAGADIITIDEADDVGAFSNLSVTDSLFVGIRTPEKIGEIGNVSGYIMSEPIITKELLEKGDYPGIKAAADEYLKKINN